MLARQGRIDEAIVAYQIAALTDPEADSRLGHLLLALDRRQEAAGRFRAAAAASPDAIARRLDLARAFILEEDDLPAEAQLRGILDDDPGCADASWLLGRILTDRGEFSEAAARYEQALADEPGLVAVYYDLAHDRTFTAADRPLVQRMLAAARTPLAAGDGVKLHLALGKAFDDLGDYGAAMRHIAKANRIKATLATLDRERLARHVDALIGLYTPEFLASRRSHGNPSELPVMIVGMPRSGTTLVEQILSSHRDVHGAGELQFWQQLNPLLNGLTTEGAITGYQTNAARRCLETLRALAPDATRVVDKNPFNLFLVGLIHVVFPRATIIHCRRHPIDTCLSISSTYFRPQSDFSTSPDDLVFYYQHYRRLMDHWRANLPPGRFIDVDYEALIADPETVSRRLVSALNLDWDDACLRPDLNRRTVKTSSKLQVRQPIHAGSVERWRRYAPWLGALRALAPE